MEKEKSVLEKLLILFILSKYDKSLKLLKLFSQLYNLEDYIIYT